MKAVQTTRGGSTVTTSRATEIKCNFTNGIHPVLDLLMLTAHKQMSVPAKLKEQHELCDFVFVFF